MLRHKDSKKNKAKEAGIVPEGLKECDIIVEEQIGSGTFGKVYNGKVKSNGTKVAVKKVLQ